MAAAIASAIKYSKLYRRTQGRSGVLAAARTPLRLRLAESSHIQLPEY